MLTVIYPTDSLPVFSTLPARPEATSKKWQCLASLCQQSRRFGQDRGVRCNQRDLLGVGQGAAYVLNVVVSQKHRKKGVGRALMAAVGRMAKEQWGSSSMCTHVSAQNEVG